MNTVREMHSMFYSSRSVLKEFRRAVAYGRRALRLIAGSGSRKYVKLEVTIYSACRMCVRSEQLHYPSKGLPHGVPVPKDVAYTGGRNGCVERRRSQEHKPDSSGGKIWLVL